MQESERQKRRLPIVGDPSAPKNPEPRLLQIVEPKQPEWREPESDEGDKEIPE